jgi:hypothetical protein
MRSQRGQTAAEYLGVLLVVSVIVASIASSKPGEAITRSIEATICRVAGGEDCGEPPPAPTPPGATREDLDGDGIPNDDEARAGLDPRSADSDGDGVPDAEEVRAGLDPLDVDTDGDGVDDRQETHSGGKLNPTRADTDGDGLTDGEELAIGTDPTEADSDGFDTHGDGLTDAEELRIGADPNHYDTDRDGNPDGYEVRKGDDPTSDERGVLQKSFEMLVLDDPIGSIVTLGTAKLVSAVGKAGAARINSLVKALRNAKTVHEAAAIRRKLIATLRERLRPNKVDPAEAAERQRLYERLASTLEDRKRRIERLVDDPARGVDDTTRLEARDAVNLEDAGAVRGPLRRPKPDRPVEDGADFVDATGRLWDHKRAISGPNFNATEFVRTVVVRDIRNGEHIMLNHRQLNALDRDALLREIDAHGLRDKFVFWPPL